MHKPGLNSLTQAEKQPNGHRWQRLWVTATATKSITSESLWAGLSLARGGVAVSLCACGSCLCASMCLQPLSLSLCVCARARNTVRGCAPVCLRVYVS